MLKAKDKIFTNLFGDQSYSLREALSRGDWDQTSDFIKKGSDSKVLDGVHNKIKNLKNRLEINEKKYFLYK